MLRCLYEIKCLSGALLSSQIAVDSRVRRSCIDISILTFFFVLLFKIHWTHHSSQQLHSFIVTHRLTQHLHLNIILAHITAVGPSKGFVLLCDKGWKLEACVAPRHRRSDASCRTGLSASVPLQRACSSLAHTDLLKSLSVTNCKELGHKAEALWKLYSNQTWGLFGKKLSDSEQRDQRAGKIYRHTESRSSSSPHCCCTSRVLSTSTNPSCPDVDLRQQEKGFYVKHLGEQYRLKDTRQ